LIDTDYAAETSNMTRQNILQQAGTAMLAQANSAPNSILNLLQGLNGTTRQDGSGRLSMGMGAGLFFALCRYSAL